MRSREVIAAPRHPLIAALFLACAIVLGGGGSPSPGMEVLLQLAFVAAALAWLWVPAGHGAVPLPTARSFWLVCALVLALPLVQLIPLPPEVWTGFGGRQADRAAALALVGREQSWQPLSLSPTRTWAALLAMIPALFAFLATASLDARGRLWVVGTIVSMVVAAALFGALQLSLGPRSWHLYVDYHPVVTGFQANRNAAADVFLIGIVAAAALLRSSLREGAVPDREHRAFARLRDRRTAWIMFVVVLAVLFFATLLTASRVGIVLLVPALAAAWLILRPSAAEPRRRRFVAAVAALIAIPVVAFAIWRVGNTALGNVAARFVFEEDDRLELWRDGWFAIVESWPFGVGLGGAQPALIAAERLEVLDPYVPNRVHNDYLELALEGGLPAIAIFAALAAILAAAAWRGWRTRRDDRHLTLLGAAILSIAAAHSFVDYPLRSMAMACLIGTGAGLLMSTPRLRPADGPNT